MVRGVKHRIMLPFAFTTINPSAVIFHMLSTGNSDMMTVNDWNRILCIYARRLKDVWLICEPDCIIGGFASQAATTNGGPS